MASWLGAPQLRVLVVHRTPRHQEGGAELGWRILLSERPADFSVTMIEPEDDVELGDHDALILSNLRPEGGGGTTAEVEPARDWLQKLPHFQGVSVRMDHDLHPCAQRDASCVSVPGFQRLPCHCKPDINQAYGELAQACSAVIYLSPGHRLVMEALIGKHSKTLVIAPGVDLKAFRSRVPWEQRRPVALITGDAIRVADDSDALAREAGFEPEHIPYLSIPYEEMPALLNQVQAVVVAPRMYHAFGRLAAEALACGCRLITNDRVGALTFEDPLKAVARGVEDFWSSLRALSDQ